MIGQKEKNRITDVINITMNGKKVFVIGSVEYANWLPMELADKVEEADLILLTGGEDVSPDLYGDVPHPTTFNSKYRDEIDLKHYRYAQETGIPCLGICRGSQFLTAIQEGGRLIQDVEGHAMGGTHSIEDIHGNKLEITSTHHQMHYPFDMNEEDYDLIAWSTAKRSAYYALGDELLSQDEMGEEFKESEIIHYPKTKCIGIQGHPEHLPFEHDTNKYLRELLEQLLF